MTPAEAARHAEHLCDVYLTERAEQMFGEHVGVVERLHRNWAQVSGHPEYGTRWLPVIDLETSCEIPD